MKHYKNAEGQMFGIEDGQPVPEGLEEISVFEARAQGAVVHEERVQQELAEADYVRQRLMSYPEIGEFLDAWVKKDEKALEEYRQKCLAVKAKYPAN